MSTGVPDRVELLRFSSAEELAAAVAARWVETLARRVDPAENHTVALPGGRIAAGFFAKVVSLIRERQVSIAGVHFFWGDERCVPPDSAESNFAPALAGLLSPLNVAPDQIHRIRGEADPVFALAEADAELCRVASLNADGMPVLDLVLLGMGEDGHVASLFPNAFPRAVAARVPFMHVTDSPKPPPGRISLSYAALAAAREVWVLASGKGKEAALRASLSSAGTTPLARVIGSRLTTRIFTDIVI